MFKSFLKINELAMAVLVALVLTLCTMSARAEGITAQLGADNSAFAGNQGVTLSNTYQTSPFSFGSIDGNQNYHTNQAWGAASSFATNAVWRCSTSGSGWSFQSVWFGINRANAGGESDICVIDFTIAVDTAVNTVLANKSMTKEQKDTVLRIA